MKIRLLETRLLYILATVLLALAAPAAIAPDSGRALLTPEAAFVGHTEGNGTLRILFGRTRAYHVESVGMATPDGRFRFDQAVRFGGEPERQRSWLIAETTPLRYAGTLSDATGPVSGEATGRRLVLRYRLKGQLVMHQALELMADGHTIDNTGHITLFDLPVGHLHETIERTGP